MRQKQKNIMGGSASKDVILNEVNSMVSSVFTEVALTCNNTAESKQIINVGCNPTLSSDNLSTAEPYENNVTCQACMKNVVEQRKNYYDLQRRSWSNRAVQVEMPIDQDYQQVVTQMTAYCGPLCKACIFQNISQKNIIKSVMDCKAMTSIHNVMDQKISAKVQQALVNNQDLLSPLAQMLGASSKQDISSNITNRISTKINSRLYTAIKNQIDNNQVIILNSTTSTNVRNATEESSFTSIMTYLGKNTIFNTIFTNYQWDELERLHNDQTMISTLGNNYVKGFSFVSKVTSSIVGAVMIFVLGVLILLVAAIFFYIVVMSVRKYITHKHSVDSVQRVEAEKLSTFQQF